VHEQDSCSMADVTTGVRITILPEKPSSVTHVLAVLQEATVSEICQKCLTDWVKSIMRRKNSDVHIGSMCIAMMSEPVHRLKAWFGLHRQSDFFDESGMLQQEVHALVLRMNIDGISYASLKDAKVLIDFKEIIKGSIAQAADGAIGVNSIHVVCRHAMHADLGEKCWTPRDPDEDDPIETTYWARASRVLGGELPGLPVEKQTILKKAMLWLQSEIKFGSTDVGAEDDWGTWPDNIPLSGDSKNKAKAPKRAGIVALRGVTTGDCLVCVCEKRNGRLSFPKGGREQHETVKQNALREWREETYSEAEASAAHGACANLRFRPHRPGAHLDDSGCRYIIAEYVEPADRATVRSGAAAKATFHASDKKHNKVPKPAPQEYEQSSAASTIEQDIDAEPTDPEEIKRLEEWSRRYQ